MAVACAPVKTAAPEPGVDLELRPYLLDPTVDCERQSPAELSAGISAAYRDLLRSGDAAAALRSANSFLEREAGGVAAETLRAQARLVAGQGREAAKSLKPLAPAAGECPALALVLGRAQEQADDVLEAYISYAAAGSRVALAADRARELSPRAEEIVRRRFSAALAAGRREAAAWHLSQAERFWPNSASALRSAMEMAQASGDARAELAAVKALQAGDPTDSTLSLRRGQLELLVGDARTGLMLIEKLAMAAPGDASLQTELARAKFAWRLLNSPEQVRGLRQKAVLTRADFAVLLYWTVPQIRTARPEGARIASDIVDHPSRDEIARVANLGLMSIDETLHRFSPDTAVRRSDAISALLRLLSDSRRGEVCAAPRGGGREALCGIAASCGLLDDALLCQAGAGISGAEAMEMLRRALDGLEGS